MENETRTPWLTRHEAADYAKVSWRTIDRWREDGLKASTIAGTVRIHIDDLNEFLRKHSA